MQSTRYLMRATKYICVAVVLCHVPYTSPAQVEILFTYIDSELLKYLNLKDVVPN